MPPRFEAEPAVLTGALIGYARPDSQPPDNTSAQLELEKALATPCGKECAQRECIARDGRCGIGERACGDEVLASIAA